MSAALAKIHIAKKELALHDDDYRAILERVTGQNTAKGLSQRQADNVLAEFERLGWKPQVIDGGKKAPRGAKARAADHPSAKKARAMWLSLWHLGVVADRREKALEAFAKRQLGCERLQWADQSHSSPLIEALKSMAQRAGWDQDMTGIKPRDQVLVLKRRLVCAICRRAGADLPRAVHGATEEVLNTMIRVYGEKLREKHPVAED